jgi:hypothetical protein
MSCAYTKYGLIKDTVLADFYQNGSIKRCVVKQRNEIQLACGTLIPQYQEDGKRKKLVKSMTFYQDGSLESIILEDITMVETKLGSIPAEMISFYESGAVKRIFPSFGTITAFWTEKDEEEFSPELSLDLPFGAFHGKAINLMFYETGELRSMTLWPKDSMVIETPAGKIRTRIGFSLYRDGNIKSLEPQEPAPVNTKIGVIPAYDPDAMGIDGDKNSLNFAKDGSVDFMLTSGASVTVLRENKKIGEHEPYSKKCEYFDNELALEPMKISFAGRVVGFGKRKDQKAEAEYPIAKCKFLIGAFSSDSFRNSCEECFG